MWMESTSLYNKNVKYLIEKKLKGESQQKYLTGSKGQDPWRVLVDRGRGGGQGRVWSAHRQTTVACSSQHCIERCVRCFIFPVFYTVFCLGFCSRFTGFSLQMFICSSTSPALCFSALPCIFLRFKLEPLYWKSSRVNIMGINF
jgi:hypothetical protein